MEDLDAPRCEPGAAAEILRTLEAFGLCWDGAVEYQSRRAELYRCALETLGSRGLLYACSCSRRDLAGEDETGYPGTCRNGPTRRGPGPGPGPTAIRFRIDDGVSVRFEDRIQGACEFALRELGDVVVRRRDGIHAYQLAVVVDDAEQAVTSVVRGADLLPSTAWQIALARALELPVPRYAHLPVVVEPDGAKLAKARRSVPVDPLAAGSWLIKALELLGQDPPTDLAREPPSSLLRWAIAHWSLRRLSRIRSVPAQSG